MHEQQHPVDQVAVANAVRDEFLGLVSHELRTPVTTIYGNAQLLRDRIGRLAPAELAAMTEDMAEDAERLLTAIENLLMLSRLQAGGPLILEPQVLVGVVHQAVAAFGRRFPTVPVRVAAGGAEHAIVEADRGHLTSLIGNLLSNAQKYGDPAAGIDVEVAIDGQVARVRVLDRGPGLGSTTPDDLFEPFFRTPEARRHQSGVGLGLAVCRLIVAALGGAVWARQRQGGGAEFGFVLPLSRSESDSD